MVPHRLRHRRRDRANQQTNHAHPPATPQTVTRKRDRPATPPYPPATTSTTNPSPATHLMSTLQRRNRQRRRETARPGGDRQVLPCTCPQAVLHHPNAAQDRRTPTTRNEFALIPCSSVFARRAGGSVRGQSSLANRFQRIRNQRWRHLADLSTGYAVVAVTFSGSRQLHGVAMS